MKVREVEEIETPSSVVCPIQTPPHHHSYRPYKNKTQGIPVFGHRDHVEPCGDERCGLLDVESRSDVPQWGRKRCSTLPHDIESVRAGLVQAQSSSTSLMTLAVHRGRCVRCVLDSDVPTSCQGPISRCGTIGAGQGSADSTSSRTADLVSHIHLASRTDDGGTVELR